IMSLSPSRRSAQFYKDFCAKYLCLNTLTIRLATPGELVSVSEALKQPHSILSLNLSYNKSIKDLEAWISFGFAMKSVGQTITQLDLNHNGLGSEGLAPIISDVIRSNRSITHLNLSHNCLDLDENNSILDALQANQTITYLDLSYNEYQCSGDVSKLLCNYLSKSKTIQTLNFGYNSAKHPLTGLPQAITDHPSLRSLDLSNMAIAESDGGALLRMLTQSKMIESILLHQCRMAKSRDAESYGECIIQGLALRYRELDIMEEASKGGLSEDDELTKLITIFSKGSSGNGANHDPTITVSPRSRPIILEHLDISGVKFGAVGFGAFLDILARNQELATLDLSGCQLNERNAEDLAKFMAVNQSIEHLNVSNNDFFEKSTSIGEALINNSALTSLNLANTKASNLIGKVMAKSLNFNHSLKVLDLSHTKLGHSGILDFVAGLGNNRITLESLSLNDTCLQDRGAQHLADALASNVTLKQLYLNTNGIGKDGCTALAKALKRNSTLRLLHIGYNAIGHKGLKALAKCLKWNRALQELSVRSNAIPEKGALYLVEHVKLNTSLEVLNLRDNQLGVKGGAHVLKLLTLNEFLINVDVSNNQIDRDIVHRIILYIRRNQYITSMNYVASSASASATETSSDSNVHPLSIASSFSSSSSSSSSSCSSPSPSSGTLAPFAAAASSSTTPASPAAATKTLSATTASTPATPTSATPVCTPTKPVRIGLSAMNIPPPPPTPQQSVTKTSISPIQLSASCARDGYKMGGGVSQQTAL
ncbi:hypothetical protein SAMD00019534_103620, partial [Acytostelium subglobosum LB1]|uniref:hypothetical protein n=1 Tax=Acytostelium subglobosum LB1 TaxID=1410327 RepID=UPI000644A46B